MNVLIIYAHPNPNSYNHAILDSIEKSLRENNHLVRVKDLNQLNFDPVLDQHSLELNLQGTCPDDIKKEQQDVNWADAMIFIHPVWWYGAPAILKGWIDRVFSQGFAFDIVVEDGVQGPKGILQHKKIMVIETTASAKVWLDKAPYQTMLPATFRFCGIRHSSVKTLYGIPYLSEEQRKDVLVEVGAFVCKELR